MPNDILFRTYTYTMAFPAYILVFRYRTNLGKSHDLVWYYLVGSVTK